MFTFQLGIVLCIAVVEGTVSTGKVNLSPKAVQGVDGGFVYVLCNGTGNSKPTIKLMKKGSAISSSRIHEFKVKDGWFVRIGPLRAGTYTCTASNGASVSTSSLQFYKVGNIPAGFPRVARHPRSRFQKSGDSVTLQCSVTGSPKPAITWTKNKVPLVIGSRVIMDADGRLTFHNLKKSDEGFYACIAQNTNGMVFSRRAKLFVQEYQRPPRFTTRPRDQTVNPDSDVILKCAADGFPRPSIVWEREGSRISGVLNGKLLIQNIKQSANYSCIGDSFLGRIQTFAFVTVRRKYQPEFQHGTLFSFYNK